MFTGIRSVASCDVCGQRRVGLSIVVAVDEHNDAGTVAHCCDVCEASTIPMPTANDGASLEPF